MKRMKKRIALILAVVMCMAMSLPVFAAQTVTVGTDPGSITISNAEKEAKYKLFKLFDATVAPDGSIAYSLPSGKDVAQDSFFNQYFEIKNGNVIAKNTFTEAVLKTDEFKTWAASFGTQIGSEVTASDTEVVFAGIPYGYYYLTSSLGTVLTVDSANPNATVIDKNQIVDFDKNIVDGEDLIKINEAGLNIEVPFDITVDARNYDGDEKIFEYVIYDTLDNGWTLQEAPVVKVADDPLAATAYTITYKDKAGTATTDLSKAEYFEISIPWTEDGTKDSDHLYDNGDKINVTYTAFLDPAKAADVKVGSTPNLNTANVKYYKGNDEPNQPSGDLGNKVTKTYETKLTIIKHDGDNNVLTGAQFTLTSENGTKVSYVYENKYVADASGTYYKLKDGTYTSEAPTNEPTHDSVYESTTQKYKLVTEAKVMGEDQTTTTISSYVGDDGTVTFSGLGTGKYKIEETVVPAGYNKADDIEFTISFEAVDDDEDPETPPVGQFSSDNQLVELDGTTNCFKTTVVNRQGTELPSTGGIGTTLFYVVGSIMVVGAAVLLISKRRMAH